MENTKGKTVTGIAKKFTGCTDAEKSELALYILGMYEGINQGKREVLQALEDNGVAVPPNLFDNGMTPVSP